MGIVDTLGFEVVDLFTVDEARKARTREAVEKIDS
jgi:hypothetical protein